MARVDIPISRARKNRRKRISIIVGLLAAGLALVCALLVAATHIPATRVERIDVRGTKTLASSTVAQQVARMLEGSYVWVVPRDSIFVYPQQHIEESLRASYPMIANVDVHAADFSTIVVEVVEREPRALYCGGAFGGDRCYFIDDHGVVYQEAPTFSSPVYVQYYGQAQGKQLPKQFLTPALFGSLSALTDAVAQKLSSTTLEGVVVDNNLDVRLRYHDGFSVLFSLKEQGGDIFERLGLALTAAPFKTHPLSDFEYLDLRFGDKLYYKLKS